MARRGPEPLSRGLKWSPALFPSQTKQKVPGAGSAGRLLGPARQSAFLITHEAGLHVPNPLPPSFCKAARIGHVGAQW